MSVNAFLLKYSFGSSGELSEKGVVNIKNSYISEHLLGCLKLNDYLVQIDVMEDDGESIVRVNAIKQEHIRDLLVFLKNEVLTKCRGLLDGEVSNKSEDNLLNVIKQLLDFRALLLEKIERYDSDNEVVIIVG